jgi:hypothetical protein
MEIWKSTMWNTQKQLVYTALDVFVTTTSSRKCDYMTFPHVELVKARFVRLNETSAIICFLKDIAGVN